MLEFGEALKAILGEVRKFKAARNLSMKAPLKSVRIASDDKTAGHIKEALKDLKACAAAGEIQISKGEKPEIYIEEV